jgi:adenylate cyclase class 2
LRSVGANLETEMTRETNVILDFAGGDLQRSGSLLRLRRYGGRCVVTFKGPASFEGTIKTRVEHETEVTDLDHMLDIFSGLGLAPVARYEKDREEWSRSGVAVVLDRTPMGDFVEIEGPRDRLLDVAAELDLDPTRGVEGSYLELWSEHRAAHREENLPADMVFPE